MQHQKRDPDSGNRRDSSDGAHHQTLVNRPHSETLLTRVDIWRSHGKYARAQYYASDSQFHFVYRSADHSTDKLSDV
jgi:hypothetical protein